MPQLSQRQIAVIATVVILVLVVLFFVFINFRGSGGGKAKITLSVWGFDPQANLESIASGYAKYRPGATVTYTQVSPDGYQNRLLTALAAGNGPDVFMIGNRDVPKLKAVMATAPSTFTLVQFQNDFPQVAADDFVSAGKIYAAPLYIDTLAMLYNKDLVNNAGIAVLPETWNEFTGIIPALRTVENGALTQSAAALGGTERTVDNGMDLLFLLMIQNGAYMVDTTTYKSATFALGQGTQSNPGIDALNFYLQFANSASSLYTWNENGGVGSLDSFAGGKTAIIFDYKKTLSALAAKSPFLRIGVAPIPQAMGSQIRTDYANYAGFAVSKSSADQIYAWDFVQYATTDPTLVAAYLKASGEPSALRTVIAAEESDPALSVFAKQALTAKSWYEADDSQIHSIMNDAVSSVLSGQIDAATALNQAQAQVTQLMTN